MVKRKKIRKKKDLLFRAKALINVRVVLRGEDYLIIDKLSQDSKPQYFFLFARPFGRGGNLGSGNGTQL